MLLCRLFTHSILLLCMYVILYHSYLLFLFFISFTVCYVTTFLLLSLCLFVDQLCFSSLFTLLRIIYYLQCKAESVREVEVEGMRPSAIPHVDFDDLLNASESLWNQITQRDLPHHTHSSEVFIFKLFLLCLSVGGKVFSCFYHILLFFVLSYCLFPFLPFIC